MPGKERPAGGTENVVPAGRGPVCAPMVNCGAVWGSEVLGMNWPGIIAGELVLLYCWADEPGDSQIMCYCKFNKYLSKCQFLKTSKHTYFFYF